MPIPFFPVQDMLLFHLYGCEYIWGLGLVSHKQYEGTDSGISKIVMCIFTFQFFGHFLS